MFRIFVLSIFAAVSVILFTVSAAAQFPIAGQVVDVIDGKTVLVATQSGQVRVELQYINVPEVGQPLYDTVREHLRTLSLGKAIEYRPRSILNDRTLGHLSIKGLDISQQMLRDGAAWHTPRQISGQEQSEFDMYASLESSAKAEKLGIWSIPALKPPWQVRSEQALVQNTPPSDFHPAKRSIGRRLGLTNEIKFPSRALPRIEIDPFNRNDSVDYARQGFIHYLNRDFRGAIPLFLKALKVEKRQRQFPKTIWLVVVDCLAISYGVTGDIKNSMRVLEYGLSVEPTYPGFYYIMACGFGEQDDESGAVKYLSLAYKYKNNMIPGERFPDPARDSSFRKLMRRESFQQSLMEMKSGM